MSFDNSGMGLRNNRQNTNTKSQVSRLVVSSISKLHGCIANTLAIVASAEPDRSLRNCGSKPEEYDMSRSSPILDLIRRGEGQRASNRFVNICESIGGKVRHRRKHALISSILEDWQSQE